MLLKWFWIILQFYNKQSFKLPNKKGTECYKPGILLSHINLYWPHNMFLDNYVNTCIEALLGWFRSKSSVLHYQDVIRKRPLRHGAAPLVINNLLLQMEWLLQHLQSNRTRDNNTGKLTFTVTCAHESQGNKSIAPHSIKFHGDKPLKMNCLVICHEQLVYKLTDDKLWLPSWPY